MAAAGVTQPADQHTQTRRREHGLPTSTSRRIAWLPLLLVVLALAGLAVTPMAITHRTRSLRADIRAISEPARAASGELRLGFAREQAIAQRFEHSQEPAIWYAYQRQRAHDDSAIARLETTLRPVGPSGRAAGSGLRTMVRAWRAGTVNADTPVGGGDAATPSALSFEDMLVATGRADSAVAQAVIATRGDIEETETVGLVLTMLFVAVGCAACAGVLTLTLRDHALRALLVRRAEEEASLRELASRLSGAFTVSEVAELTIAAALQSSRIAGAYVSRPHGNELVTIAARGTCGSTLGARVPMPRWLSDRTRRDEPRVYMTETRAPAPDGNGGDTARYVRSLLVVPLRHDDAVIGTIGIASAGGRRRFGESAFRFGRALADLAAVALHRAEALDSERRARSEAEAAVRTRDAVVSIVSHDLRNPLMAIMGSADILFELTSDGKSDGLRGPIATLKHAADAMGRLIRDLLDVARLEAGPIPVKRRPVRILDVVDEVVGMFQVVARTRRVTMHRDAPAEVPPVLGDHDRLAQAFGNLVGNAVKFTPEGGHIGLRVETHPADVRICVTDNGPGIPADQIPHLFDRFWQASREDSRGLGLGLSIVKAIADAHGGYVNVESSLEKGSTFCLVLPRADVPSEARPAPPPPSVGNAEPARAQRARPTTRPVGRDGGARRE